MVKIMVKPYEQMDDFSLCPSQPGSRQIVLASTAKMCKKWRNELLWEKSGTDGGFEQMQTCIFLSSTPEKRLEDAFHLQANRIQYNYEDYISIPSHLP